MHTTIAVLVGILINRSDAASLRTEIGSIRREIAELRGEMQSQLAAVRADMTALRSQFHSDVVHFLNVGREQEGRIARLEERP